MTELAPIAILLLLIILPAVLVLRKQTHSSAEKITHEATCGGCGYDLAGLASNASCPECGSPNPSQRIRKLDGFDYELPHRDGVFLLATISFWAMIAFGFGWIWRMENAWKLWMHGFDFHAAATWYRHHVGNPGPIIAFLVAAITVWIPAAIKSGWRWAVLAVIAVAALVLPLAFPPDLGLRRHVRKSTTLAVCPCR